MKCKNILKILLTTSILFLYTNIPPQFQATSTIYAAKSNNYDSYVKYLINGNKLYSQAKYKEAMKTYNTALKYASNYPEAYYNIGLCYYMLSNFDDAIKYFDKSIKVNPKNADAYYMKGKVLVQNKKKYTEGITSLDMAIKLNPKNADAYYNKGAAKYYLKQYSDALKVLDKATQLKPDCLDAYYTKANIYYNTSRYNDAINALNKILKYNKTYPKVYSALGLCYEKLSNYKKALENYKISIKLDPTYKYAVDKVNEISAKLNSSNNQNSSQVATTNTKVDTTNKVTTKNNVIEPSNVSQTITCNENIKVTIPADVLSSSKTLTVTPVNNLPSLNATEFKELQSFDITLGDMHKFDKDLTIEIPVSADIVKDAVNYSVVYWNEKQNTWELVPSRFDETKNVVRFNTNHLTTFRVLAWWKGYQGVYKTKNFCIIYDKKEILGEKGTTDPSKIGVGYKNLDGRKEDLTATHPLFVTDMGEYLDKAFDKYADMLGYMPGQADLEGYYEVFAGLNSNFREKISGLISIGQVNFNSDQLKTTTAHELFHVFQNHDYSSIGMSVFGCKQWWIEATAEYASTREVWDKAIQRSLNTNYFEHSLDYYGDEHEYETALFIDYLKQKAGINFVDMYKAVLQYNSSFKGTLDALTPLETYVQNATGKSLGEWYSKFVKYSIFESPFGDKDTFVAFNKMPSDSLVLGDGKGVIEYQGTLDKNYTARMLSFIARGKNKKLKFKVKLNNVSNPETKIDIVYSKINLKPLTTASGNLTYCKTLSQTGASCDIEVPNGSYVYLVIINPSKSNSNVNLKVTLDDFTLSSKAQNSTKTADLKVDGSLPPNGHYEWSFGDGNTETTTTNTISHKYDFEFDGEKNGSNNTTGARNPFEEVNVETKQFKVSVNVYDASGTLVGKTEGNITFSYGGIQVTQTVDVHVDQDNYPVP